MCRHHNMKYLMLIFLFCGIGGLAFSVLIYFTKDRIDNIKQTENNTIKLMGPILSSTLFIPIEGHSYMNFIWLPMILILVTAIVFAMYFACTSLCNRETPELNGQLEARYDAQRQRVQIGNPEQQVQQDQEE